jgi:hypothetical protein
MPFPIIGRKKSTDLYTIGRSHALTNYAIDGFTLGTPTDNDKCTLSFWYRGTNGMDNCYLFESSGVGNNYLVVQSLGTQGTLSVIEYIASALTCHYIFDGCPGLLEDSWSHYVIQLDSTTTAENRVKMQVNGNDLYNSSMPQEKTQNENWEANKSGNTHLYGYILLDPNYGLLTEVYFIDGQIVDDTAFGQPDSRGLWMPRKYTGTYGDNGYYLDMDGSDAGDDASGNANHFTAPTADWFDDTPTNIYPMFRDTYGQMNLTAAYGNRHRMGGTTTSLQQATRGTHSFCAASGKYTFETTWVNNVTAHNANYMGFYSQTDATYYIFSSLGNRYSGGGWVAWGNTWGTGDDVAIEVDIDNGTVAFSINGVSEGNAYTGLSLVNNLISPIVSTYGTSGIVVTDNYFGWNSTFANTPTAGYIGFDSGAVPAATTTEAQRHFDVIEYTGNGSSIQLTGLGFQPDLILIKNWDTSDPHIWFDSVQGINKGTTMNEDATGTRTLSTGLTAFNADGFTLGYDATYGGRYNESGENYTALCWKFGTICNAVEYSGTGVAQNIAHGMSNVPYLVMVWNKGGQATNSVMYHFVMDQGNYAQAGTAAAESADATVWDNTAPDATNVRVGTSALTNDSGEDYIMYVFADETEVSMVTSHIGNDQNAGTIMSPYLPNIRAGYTKCISHAVDDAWYVKGGRGNHSCPPFNYEFSLSRDSISWRRGFAMGNCICRPVGTSTVVNKLNYEYVDYLWGAGGGTKLNRVQGGF